MEQMPVFVKISQPEEVRKLISFLRNKILETRASLDKIESIYHEQNSKLQEWKSNFGSANEKIMHINEMLPEPERI